MLINEDIDMTLVNLPASIEIKVIFFVNFPYIPMILFSQIKRIFTTNKTISMFLLILILQSKPMPEKMSTCN